MSASAETLVYFHTTIQKGNSAKIQSFEDLVVGTRVRPEFGVTEQAIFLGSGELQMDLSFETAKTGQFPNEIKLTKEATEDFNFSFSVTISRDLRSFSGTYTNHFGFKHTWQGTSFTPDVPVAPPAPQPPVADPTPVTPPPPYTPTLTPDKLADELLHMTPVEAAPLKPDDPNSRHVYVDRAQEEANKSFQHILLQSLPEDSRKKLFPNLSPLSNEEQEIRDKYKDFFEAAAIPYLAQYFVDSPSVSQDLKDHIDKEKSQRFFTVLGSQPPGSNEKDPISEFGWKRDDEKFIKLRDGFLEQQNDIYALGFAAAMPKFKDFLAEPKRWHDHLSTYLTDPNFTKLWAMQNASTSPHDSHQVMYMWYIKLQLLEKAAVAKGQSLINKTTDVFQSLVGSIIAQKAALASWSEEMYHSFKFQVESIVGYSEQQIAEIMKANQEAARKLVMIRQAVFVAGSTAELVDTFDRCIRILSRATQKRAANAASQPGVLIELEDFRPPVANVLNGATEAQRNILNGSVEHIDLDDILRHDALDFSSSHAGGPGLDDARIEFRNQVLAQEQTTEIQAQNSFSRWKKIGQAFGDHVFPVMGWLMQATAFGLSAYIFSQGPTDNLASMAQLGFTTLHAAVGTIKGVAKFIGEHVWSGIKSGGFSKWLLATEKAGASAIELSANASSKLLKTLKTVFGASAEAFTCLRLAPFICVLGVCSAGYELYRSIKSGVGRDIAFASVTLCLAVLDTAVLVVGIAGATAAEGTLLAACASFCGPVGWIIAVVGIALVAWHIFGHERPKEESPMQEFVNGPVKNAGFYKS